MGQKLLFSATLGLSPPWQVTSILFVNGEKRIDINIAVDFAYFLKCPQCGISVNTSSTDVETWYHGDFFRHATYLHVKVPRTHCCGAPVPLERPWSRPGSRFSRFGMKEEAQNK